MANTPIDLAGLLVRWLRLDDLSSESVVRRARLTSPLPTAIRPGHVVVPLTVPDISLPEIPTTDLDPNTDPTLDLVTTDPDLAALMRRFTLKRKSLLLSQPPNALRAELLDLASQFGREVAGFTVTLAHYRSPRLASLDQDDVGRRYPTAEYGIYLHAAGVERLATRVYVAAGFTDREAIGLALGDLLAHELTHAAFDVTCIRIASDYGVELPPRRTSHRDSEPEEALANAAVAEIADLRLLHAQCELDRATTGDMRVAAVSHLARLREAARIGKARMTAGPPGYRAWETVRHPGPDRDSAIAAAFRGRGIGASDTATDLLLATAERMQTGALPTHLVLTPGSAAANGLWSPPRTEIIPEAFGIADEAH